ncbi:MAG: metal-dependent hydrolase [Candidatus Heimdallarchaeota archaeon]
MPFTLYHLGPGLLFGLFLFRYIDFPTFLVANIIVDIEPFLVLTFNLQYPLHGFFHSYLGGTFVALILVAIMSKTGNSLSPLISVLKLEQKLSFNSIISASLIGVYLHIFLDSFLYTDIKPVYPFDYNPLLSQNMFIGSEIYLFCTLTFIGGGVIYVIKQVSQRRISRSERI